MRPLVAISTTSRESSGVERVRLNQTYVSAIEDAGLVPILIPPLGDPRDTRRVLDAVHGLVLSGGEDVDPSLYGVDPHPATHPPQRARDATELELVRAARELGLPTLAICRGVQIVNVALGGSLIQDIPTEVSGAGDHDENDVRHQRIHDVVIEPASRLAGVFESAHIRVNSIHHQALERVAAGLRVTARAEDGVVEGVEWIADDWWMLGVQWHPEELTGTSEAWDRRLFRAFAHECEVRAAAPTHGTVQRG